MARASGRIEELNLLVIVFVLLFLLAINFLVQFLDVMPKKTYGSQVKKRVKRLLEALLCFVDGEFESGSFDIKHNDWIKESSTNPKLIVQTTLIALEWLTQKDQYPGKLTMGKQLLSAITFISAISLNPHAELSDRLLKIRVRQQKNCQIAKQLQSLALELVLES
ncbi:MAG: hypothetical protein ACYTX0_38375, partial [Nostoc sp.]